MRFFEWSVSRLAILAAAGIAALAASSGWLVCAGQDGKPASTAATAPIHSLDITIIDKTCKPCADLFKYADGGWIEKNPIPAAYPSWGRFNELQERNREFLRQIPEQAAGSRSAPAGSNEQKIGDFYASCMDEAKVEADGAKPLDPELARIERLDSLSGIESEIARLQSLGVNALFRFRSTQDAKNSSQVIGGASQAGLGLPDRDYYTKSDDKSKQLRAQYVQHVTNMFGLMGDDLAKAAAEAKTVMSMETTLAEASMTRVDRRDPDKTYHKMAPGDLAKMTPSFAWPLYFHDVGFPGINDVDVGQPKFFEAVNGMLTSVPVEDWKTYLRWHLIDAAAPGLSKKFVEEDFNFNSRILQGTQEILPRWKRCVRTTDRELGFALGRVYVDKYFPPEAKARVLELVHNLIAALHDDISTLPWMSPETRKAALAKLEAFSLKIGYPDKWRDYSALTVDRGSYVLNFFNGERFEFNRDLGKIGKPVDRAEWGMSPPTVNAYYSSLMNEIVFPAGILQPPFFDAQADDAVNYGGIGAVIGHEMTHGFDDQGRKFDADGNLKNWWTPDDLKNYEARAACVEKQFDGYVVSGDVHENGKLVLGESIADLGGLTIAYRAYQKSLEGNPQPAPIDGLTAERRFFLSYAQVWAGSDRPQFELLMVNTNPHPLDRFRAIAAPSNMPVFAQAFSCQAGDAMVRSQPCQIW